MFKRINPLPRLLTTVLLLVIALTLLGATYYAINPVQASRLAPVSTSTPDLDPAFTPTPGALIATFSTEELEAVSPDTSGISIMGIFLAAIIIFGIFWGLRTSRLPRK